MIRVILMEWDCTVIHEHTRISPTHIYTTSDCTVIYEHTCISPTHIYTSSAENTFFGNLIFALKYETRKTLRFAVQSWVTWLIMSLHEHPQCQCTNIDRHSGLFIPWVEYPNQLFQKPTLGDNGNPTLGRARPLLHHHSLTFWMI